MTAMSSPQQPQGYGPPQGYAPPQPYAPQGQPQGQPQPYAPQGQQQGQPQPYGGAPTGELVLNLQKPFGSMGMISPIVSIDGYPAAASWGRNVFPAPAGVRRVDVAQSYLWTYGRASMPVTVQPGSSSEIWYCGPMWTFGMPGAMGTEPQKRPGKGLLIGLLAFIAAVLLFAIVVGVASSS